ncbi:MAG: hypothetical protein BroJett026_10340 [Betaproteobacteria bacterium]|nr:MAG: hypothetical protein BroJett026_10340 [Betaproteobacteria bacterium]
MNAPLAPLRHPRLPLVRVARARAAMLPSAWMPRVEAIAAAAGEGVCAQRGARLDVFLPDPVRDRAFVHAVRDALGHDVELGALTVRRGDGPFGVRPLMRYRARALLRLGGALRGELHRHRVDVDAFDVTLHGVHARGRAPLDALLALDGWIASRADGDAELAMRLDAWEPHGPGPRAA